MRVARIIPRAQSITIEGRGPAIVRYRARMKIDIGQGRGPIGPAGSSPTLDPAKENLLEERAGGLFVAPEIIYNTKGW